MKILYHLTQYTALILVYMISGFLFEGNHLWMLLVTLLSAWGLCSLFLKKSKRTTKYLEVIKVILPFFVLLFSVSVSSSFTYTFTYLIFLPIVGGVSYWYIIKPKVYKLLLSVGIIGMAVFVFFPNQFVFTDNLEPDQNIAYQGLALMDAQKNKVLLDTNKTIVLDFWTTSCGVCFKKFPNYEQVYKKYKTNKNIEIYTVNVPIKRDRFSKTVALVDKLGYEFPTLYLHPNEDIKEKYNISSYPYILIIKNRKIVYSGRMETSPLVLKNNLYNEIDKTL